MDQSTPFAITMGDPAGIGPEIIAMSLAKHAVSTRNIVFGCPNVMRRAIAVTGVEMEVKEIAQIDDACFASGRIEVFATSNFAELPDFGVVASVCGQAAFDAITKASNTPWLAK